MESVCRYELSCEEISQISHSRGLSKESVHPMLLNEIVEDPAVNETAAFYISNQEHNFMSKEDKEVLSST